MMFWIRKANPLATGWPFAYVAGFAILVNPILRLETLNHGLMGGRL